ncbi:MAG TPA: hypothetical protein VGQ65_04200 [Thermoanaerobaculia bacterium]|jgi:hypothetical protein|nr:hypothetical protein [Thermoanaerobaculia bacterium]
MKNEDTGRRFALNKQRLTRGPMLAPFDRFQRCFRQRSHLREGEGTANLVRAL